jgi:hypothetical protein
LWGDQFTGEHWGHSVVSVEGPFDVMHVDEMLAGLPYISLGHMGNSVNDEQVKEVKKLLGPKLKTWHVMLDPNMLDQKDDKCRTRVRKFRRVIGDRGIRPVIHLMKSDPKYYSRDQLISSLRKPNEFA